MEGVSNPLSSEEAVRPFADITLLLRDGDRAGARAEFARLEASNPPNLDALRAWFSESMR
jgi:hypothetical protein